MFESSRRYYLYDQPVDMRKGFDSLCGVVRHQMGMNIQYAGCGCSKIATSRCQWSVFSSQLLALSYQLSAFSCGGECGMECDKFSYQRSVVSSQLFAISF